MLHFFLSVSIIDLEQVNASRVYFGNEHALCIMNMLADYALTGLWTEEALLLFEYLTQ